MQQQPVGVVGGVVLITLKQQLCVAVCAQRCEYATAEGQGSLRQLACTLRALNPACRIRSGASPHTHYSPWPCTRSTHC